MSDTAYCVYCGDWSQCRDHVIPVSYSQTYRNYRVGDTVPCCHLCNTLAGDSLHFSVQSKSRYLVDRYLKKFKKVLKIPDWSPSDLRDLDYGLRTFVESRLYLRELVESKLCNLRRVSDGFEAVRLNEFSAREGVADLPATRSACG